MLLKREHSVNIDVKNLQLLTMFLDGGQRFKGNTDHFVETEPGQVGGGSVQTIVEDLGVVHVLHLQVLQLGELKEEPA